MKADFHVHTVYSDGKNTPEEMIVRAIELGMDAIGFSDHSYTDFDESYCMKKSEIGSYISEIRALGKKYASEIKVFCGIEQDVFSAESTQEYDYVIASMHYLHCADEYIPVDSGEDKLKYAVDKYFAGSYLCMAKAYFGQYEALPDSLQPSVIGHFDLITKYNEKSDLLDTTCAEYKTAWQKAARRLLAYHAPFEINTGAISRGYRTTPYPDPDMRAFIMENGGKLILSGDCHNTQSIMHRFEDYRQLPGVIDFMPQ